jgi:hypothetical protein
VKQSQGGFASANLRGAIDDETQDPELREEDGGYPENPGGFDGEEASQPVDTGSNGTAEQGVVTADANEPQMFDAKATLFEFTITFGGLQGGQQGGLPGGLQDGPVTVLIDGVETGMTISGGKLTIGLRDGQTAIIKDLPVGTWYTVEETTAYGYKTSSENHQGSISKEGVTAAFTNYFVGEEPEQLTLTIQGKKTWDLSGADAKLPDSITLQLKNGEEIIDTIIVKPDKNGEWKYERTIPKPASGSPGAEQPFTLELIEVPVPGFTSEINGYDVHNTYDPGTIVPPDKPDKPDKPEKPKPPTPQKPGNPGKPGDPKRPVTGDENNIWPWIIILIASAVALRRVLR